MLRLGGCGARCGPASSCSACNFIIIWEFSAASPASGTTAAWRVSKPNRPCRSSSRFFSEDYTFIEERLPLILAQSYPDFEVILVYVGQDTDFYEDLMQLRHSFPQISTTKILLDPRFPISRKMALNVGIKSAHYEHLLFTSTDAVPQTDRWLALMAKGFTRGEVVLGYCGVERTKGLANYLMRAWRMMHAAGWIARAVRGRAYRGTLHNFGFTKSLYFRGQRLQPPEHEHRRGRPLPAADHHPGQRERHPLAAGHAVREDVGRAALVDEPAALLRLLGALLPRGRAELHPLGDDLPRALLPHGALRPGGHAPRIQARGPAACARPLRRGALRGAAHRAAPGRDGPAGPLLPL